MAMESQNKVTSKSKKGNFVTESKKQILVLKVESAAKDGSGTKSKAHRFDKSRIVIGSVVSADLRLTGDRISPIHAVIEFFQTSKSGKAECIIYDLASLSGVQVNGKKVITQTLEPQDSIRIGKYTITPSFEDFDSSSSNKNTRKSEGRTLFLNPKEDLKPLILEDERDVIEVFDFRPTQKKALEIVMSWCGSILNIEHFEKKKVVTVGGSRKDDFGIPSLLSSEKFPLARRAQGQTTLTIDQNMSGVIQSKGALRSLEEIREENSSSSSGLEIHLSENDFAKISIGDIDLYLSHTAAPPKLKRRRIFERDPFFTRIFFLSLMFTAAGLFSLTKVKLSPSEQEQVPERIATILYEPEKFMKPVPTPTPKPTMTVVPKPVVTPQPAQTPPPKIEPKKDIKVKPKMAKVTPNANPKKPPSAPPPTSGTGGGAEGKGGGLKVNDSPKFEFLKGAGGQIQAVLGKSLVAFGESNKNIDRVGNFADGGLALSGNGKGGKSDIKDLIGGSGQAKTGIGTGINAAKGISSGIVGGKIRVDIRSNGPDEAVVMGSVDRDAVAEAIMAHKDEFRYCYEKEVNAGNPNLSGEVMASFVIGASGRVTQSGVVSSSLKNPSAEGCILNVLKRIQFPQPKGGGVVEVHYPFKFAVSK